MNNAHIVLLKIRCYNIFFILLYYFSRKIYAHKILFFITADIKNSLIYYEIIVESRFDLIKINNCL